MGQFPQIFLKHFVSDTISIFFIPDLEAAVFPKRVGSFCWRMVFRNQDLGMPSFFKKGVCLKNLSYFRLNVCLS